MNNWRILVGDVRDRLSELEAGSVQCCVTSPPYWGAQRDYEHASQIGHERTPELFVAELVTVFREVRRVMRADGTLWLNIGDSYAASGKGGGGSLMSKRKQAWGHRDRMRGWRGAPPGYKAKDIVGVPWLLATALRSDGWYLRRDIIWAKPVPTEPTRQDRPVVQHEIVFLLSKSKKYLYVLPEAQEGTVWLIASGQSDEHHAATMPAELAERCIERGSRQGDMVLDPFTGRGTTGIAALRMGRSFVGVELSDQSVQLARKNIGSVAPMFAQEVA